MKNRIKKLPKKLLAAVLALALIAGAVPVFANGSSYTNWPSFGLYDKYLATLGFVHFKGYDTGYQYSMLNYFCVLLHLDPGMAGSALEPESPALWR